MHRISTIALFLFMLGSLFAMQGADGIATGTPGQYSYAGQPVNYTTEGGNITPVNLTGNTSTQKWAGFFGNVSGDLILGYSATQFMYTWTWSATTGGEVCASPGNNINWASAQPLSAPGEIDAAWSFNAGDADAATNTFTQTTTLDIEPVGLLPGVHAAWDLQGWQTGAIKDQLIGPTKTDIMFCVNLTSVATRNTVVGANTGMYQLLVATNETAGAYETYYFYLELS